MQLNNDVSLMLNCYYNIRNKIIWLRYMFIVSYTLTILVNYNRQGVTTCKIYTWIDGGVRCFIMRKWEKRYVCLEVAPKKVKETAYTFSYNW